MSEIVNGLDAEPPADGDDPSPRDGDAAKNGGDPAPTPKKAPQLHRPSYYAESFHEHFFPHPYDEAVDSSASTPPPRKKLSIAQRYAVSMARRPKTHLSIAFAIAVVLSVLGLQFGNFAISVDNAGWWSRGTLISNRATQEMLVNMNREDLFYDVTGEVWEELTTVIQPNWQGTRDDEEEKAAEEVDDETLQDVCSGKWYGSADMVRSREKNLVSIWKTADAEDSNPQRSMLEVDAMYDLCVAEQNTLAALEADDSCYKCPASDGNEAEGDGKCIQPYSLVLMARLYLAGNDISQLHTLSETISCDALRSAWTPSVQKHFTMTLGICTDWSIRMASGGANVTLPGTDISVTNPCPFPIRFTPTVVDGLFPSSDPPIVRYSSSYYATKKGKDEVEGMFEASQDKEYDRSDGDPMSGVYDTTDEDFSALYSDAIVGRDMALAVGSAGVTVIAMLIHTRSPFLTLMGLFQIILSFPLAYFFYYFVAGLVFFPFLNFIGIFVVFALGADDVFVAVDKWKNARHELPHGSTEQVAALALPDAAYAMLLTSLTTAVAFFGTAICPVGPIVCFAVFCGLLIVFDYLMNIFLVFPALCLYDKWLLAGSKNCCVSFNSCRRQETDAGSDADETDTTVGDKCVVADVERSIPVGGTLHSASEEDGANSAAKGSHSNPDDEDAEREGLLDAEHQTLIHRILDGYYKILHKVRWAVLAVVTAAFVACTVFAAQLALPTSSDVAILPESNEYQMHWTWKQNLLPVELAKEEGSSAMITWGVTPADTGDHLNPDSWTTLVLDETFDPRTQEAQSYLLSFCNRLFGEFGKVKEDYTCPMNVFDEWLQEQSTSDMPTEAYLRNCDGSSSAPVPSDVFDQCFISWSKLYNNTSVLQSEGRVRTLTLRTKSNVTYDAPFNELKDEWTTYETWMENERDSAPSGVDKAFNSDITYWWLDTNEQMLRTAYGAAGIALVCAAIVIFVSSRSFVLTLFATVSIAYVLLATTACLVGLGWELGFLESILFAIVIGISCDFVIHVGHAYTMYSGSVVRQYRSHFALTHMGPSILAAAFTTFMAAVVMIFTEITFFTKFAVILFMTIVHSTIGCFIVFLVLCDCFGPAEPTKGYDTLKAGAMKLCGKSDRVGQ